MKSGPFKTLKAAVRWYQVEGFRVGSCRCRRCNHRWLAVVHPDTVAWKLECAECWQFDNWFTEWGPVG